MYNNEDRAQTASSAVEFFARETGISNEDLGTKLNDLIANLMHLCEQNDLDFDEITGHARHVFEEEQKEDAADE